MSNTRKIKKAYSDRKEIKLIVARYNNDSSLYCNDSRFKKLLSELDLSGKRYGDNRHSFARDKVMARRTERKKRNRTPLDLDL